jgi:hypothetical protein
VLDREHHWKKVRFVPTDSFMWEGPEGGRQWRIVEPGDSERTDGSIVPGGWDHEHCAICNARIEAGGSAYVNDYDDWLCERCHDRWVAAADLGFVIEGF